MALGPLAAQAAREALPERPARLLHGAGAGAGSACCRAPTSTGVAFAMPVKNQLAAFRLVNPRGVRIGVLYNADERGRAGAGGAEGGGRRCAWRIVARGRWRPSKEVPAGAARAAQRATAVDALWLPPDPLLLGDEARRFLLAETLKAGKPVYAFSSALVAEGALVSNGARLRVDRRAGGRAREPAGRGREGRGSSCWCRGRSW